MSLDELTFTPAICYEVAYPQLFRRRIEDSELIVVVSENSWLGNTTGPRQHMQIAQMRALELGLPLVRSTNDGITAHVDSNGTIVAQSPLHQTDVLRSRVVLGMGDTFYARFGAMVIWLLYALVIGYLMVLKRQGEDLILTSCA